MHPIIIPNPWLVHIGAFCLGGYQPAYRLGLGILRQEASRGLALAVGAAGQGGDEAVSGGAECYLCAVSGL